MDKIETDCAPQMTLAKSLYHTYQRYRSLQTHEVKVLPLVILMPHSACNCRCIMCDIWKDNKQLKQLQEKDIEGLLKTLRKLGTQQVLMSGGEALLNPNFFRFCEMLNNLHIDVVLLSTGLTLEKHAENIVRHVKEVIVSLDGDQQTHNYIRNIPGAFTALQKGIESIKKIAPSYKISGRTVIHKINFRSWPAIIQTAKTLGLSQVSFLPADVSSHAFNREVLWSDQRQQEILPALDELPELEKLLNNLIVVFREEFESGFIAEHPEKLRNIYHYYAACYGIVEYPYKKCNAPWVSIVVEADGTTRPCFFHAASGNIRERPLENILNSKEAVQFRKELDVHKNSTCRKCVCYLHLTPGTNLSS